MMETMAVLMTTRSGGRGVQSTPPQVRSCYYECRPSIAHVGAWQGGPLATLAIRAAKAPKCAKSASRSHSRDQALQSAKSAFGVSSSQAHRRVPAIVSSPTMHAYYRGRRAGATSEQSYGLLTCILQSVEGVRRRASCRGAVCLS